MAAKPELRKVQSIDPNSGVPVLTERWEVGGVLHREDGPALIRLTMGRNVENRDEMWYRNGKLHRDGAPARKTTATSRQTGLPQQEQEFWYNEDSVNPDMTQSRRYDRAGTLTDVTRRTPEGSWETDYTFSRHTQLFLRKVGAVTPKANIEFEAGTERPLEISLHLHNAKGQWELVGHLLDNGQQTELGRLVASRRESAEAALPQPVAPAVSQHTEGVVQVATLENGSQMRTTAIPAEGGRVLVSRLFCSPGPKGWEFDNLHGPATTTVSISAAGRCTKLESEYFVQGHKTALDQLNNYRTQALGLDPLEPAESTAHKRNRGPARGIER